MGDVGDVEWEDAEVGHRFGQLADGKWGGGGDGSITRPTLTQTHVQNTHKMLITDGDDVDDDDAAAAADAADAAAIVPGKLLLSIVIVGESSGGGGMVVVLVGNGRARQC